MAKERNTVVNLKIKKKLSKPKCKEKECKKTEQSTQEL